MKEASKRTQALRYLIDKIEVAVEDIAAAIPQHGGIEKLARLADDEDRDDQDEDDQDEDAPEDVEATKRKLGEQIPVGLSLKLIKKLNRFADNTWIKIIGHIRVPSDRSPTIDAKKITKIRAKAETTGKNGKSKSKAASKQPREDARDWED